MMSKKWNDIIEKGPEYGTTEAAWKGVLVEADRRCDLHSKVRDCLANDVIQKIKQWQKDTYHKVINCLKYGAVKKMQDRVQKSKEEVLKCKEKYEVALQEINQYNPKYMEDMTVVFDKCQEMEAQRLRFIKETLFDMHKYLNISQDPMLNQIYEELYHTVNNADFEKDLKWWSNNHGVNMAMNWPQFEDYTEEFRDIHKGKSKDSGTTGITLINQRPVGEDLHDYSTNTNKSTKTKAAAAARPTSTVVATPVTQVQEAKSPSKSVESPPSRGATITNGSASKANDSNPFEEEDWESDALVDNGEPGVPVKALYDYEGAENDELTFKTGDVFEKLEDEDEQGWCKGRKDGRVGLYPANYVDLVSP
ncbi:hypothetical protein D910_10973 [Dendroctonus ponderosae]|uniref:SH3 domain-containing protein n=1 Tax=Dendroctonus ponderosae TaxID=77166 RepID=U4UU53_DENPD|nr:hypothetical protein D910_10973 [Dendroctonus ponderosae]